MISLSETGSRALAGLSHQPVDGRLAAGALPS